MATTDLTVTYHKSRPRETFTLAYEHPLPNAPGMVVVGAVVEYPPSGSTPPHRHGGAFVTAHVLEGAVLSGMNDQPATVYRAGETWYEDPGCHHRVSDNASTTEPAKFFVVMVVEENHGSLVVIDEEYRWEQE